MLRSEKSVVGSAGFEPATSAMSRRRHDQLDHEPGYGWFVEFVFKISHIRRDNLPGRNCLSLVLTPPSLPKDSVIPLTFTFLAKTQRSDTSLSLRMTRRSSRRKVRGIANNTNVVPYPHPPTPPSSSYAHSVVPLHCLPPALPLLKSFFFLLSIPPLPTNTTAILNNSNGNSSNQRQDRISGSGSREKPWGEPGAWKTGTLRTDPVS